jgi:nucleoside-diphosphate-sugar epimerase
MYAMGISSSNRVIVTGAAGNLGSKIAKHLSQSQWRLELLDNKASEQVICADLSRYTEDWVKRFSGAAAVIHLAGASWPYDDWSLLQSGNIDALVNVLEASVANGVSRFVFASSLLTMDGYKNARGIIRPQMPARPLSPMD